MEQNLFLSPKEKSVAEQHLAKFERHVRNWNRSRWLFLGLGILCLVAGSCEVFLNWPGTDGLQSFVERLDSIEMPSEVPPDYWFVGELRRTARFVELQYEMLSQQMMMFVIGILLFSGGVVHVSILLCRWNNGDRDAVLAKILRVKWNKLIVSEDINSATGGT
jgi:hypothetical protein